jgi:large-conductance mechanosensitive channel
MNTFLEEVISFIIITFTVLLLAYFTKKKEDEFKDN